MEFPSEKLEGNFIFGQDFLFFGTRMPKIISSILVFFFFFWLGVAKYLFLNQELINVSNM